MGSFEDASPNSESGYVTASLNSVAHNTPPTSTGRGHSNSMPSTQANFNSLQTLSLPMTISNPHTAVMM